MLLFIQCGGKTVETEKTAMVEPLGKLVWNRKRMAD